MSRLGPALTSRFARVTGWHIASFFALAAVVVSFQKYFAYAYNNYRVFSGSLKVLLAHQNLYEPHPEYYGDLFKYSPTFPLFMAPLAWQPVVTGLICWNVLNALSLYAAIMRLWPGQRRALVALALLAVELVGSLQHTQSNALVAALMILAFAELEHERSWRAGFYIAAGFFLKGYGAAIGAVTLLYRSRVRAISATVVWFVALALAPLVVLSVGELVQQYRDWLGVRGTFTVMRNSSIMRVLALYVGPAARPAVVQAIGGVLFLLPFARVAAWPDPRFRIRLLSSLLIAIVIFNQSAEPPTYIIAITGCAIWYASEPRRSRLDRWLLLPLLVAMTLISTDLYPRALRGAVAGPWTVKAVGCLLIWLRINWDLLVGRYGPAPADAPAAA